MALLFKRPYADLTCQDLSNSLNSIGSGLRRQVKRAESKVASALGIPSMSILASQAPPHSHLYREFRIVNLLVRLHYIIVMIGCTGHETSDFFFQEALHLPSYNPGASSLAPRVYLPPSIRLARPSRCRIAFRFSFPRPTEGRRFADGCLRLLPIERSGFTRDGADFARRA